MKGNTFNCPACGTTYEFQPEYEGRNLLCEGCGCKLRLEGNAAHVSEPVSTPPVPPKSRSRKPAMVAVMLLVLGGVGIAGYLSFVKASGEERHGEKAMPVMSAEVKPAGNPLDLWREADFNFAPDVEAAFLEQQKANALRKLSASGKSLPADFIAWVDSDPAIKATVYGARQDPTGILLNLRSLEIDLGPETVRNKYTQLALAMAVVHAKDGGQADMNPRPRLNLVIGGDPRKPVDTKNPNRPLDLNDHIINFLNENTIEEDVVVGQREELPELKYDSNGVAIQPKPAKGKPKMVPITEKRARTLYAADVIASKALQEKFNACMKEKGQSVQIDCGDHVVDWKSHDMVRGEANKRVAEAYKLFKTAYEAKGLLPAQRDPFPTLAERCAYLIRNDEYRFPAELEAQRKWPRYPLTAPWPTLTLLAADNQPLREREERWTAFRDKGEFKTYGEYIGGIAQQFDMQSARRLKEHPFTYGTIQMMLKDGGVCGTMANISARSHNTLGVPASTAGQPGHCALVLFAFDPKTGVYNCHGAQYATAGDAGTHVHTSWSFGDVDARRPMVYHQSIAWSVNHGFQSYLDSTVAHTFYKQLPEEDRAAHGATLLESGLSLSPYNFLLVDDALENEKQPEPLIAFWTHLKSALAAGGVGCPTNGLYNETIRDKLFTRLAALPVPPEPKRANIVLVFLRRENCDNQFALAAYKVTTDGLPALLAETRESFTNHLVGERTDQTCALMSDALAAAAAKIQDKKLRSQWAAICWQEIQGHELYLGRKNTFTGDKSLTVLGKLAGKKPRSEAEQVLSLLNQLGIQFQTEVSEPRTPQSCKQAAARITAVAGQIKDEEQKKQWLSTLAKSIAGKETYTVASAKGSSKPQRDPCADVIAQLLKSPPKGTSL